MKRIYSLFLLFLSIIVFSQPISREDALNKARYFYQQKQVGLVRSVKEFKITYTSKPRNRSMGNYFYVVNVGNNEGFVIVSGDKRVKTILGYSLSGYFEHKNLPDNLQSWLGQYEKQIDYIIKNNIQKIPEMETYGIIGNPVEVKPLLNTKWNQSYPYNNLCPEVRGRRTPTGCVATAVSQIMKYHEWPLKGTGSHTYRPPRFDFSITADFGNTEYDWGNMKNFYERSTEDINDAVATLMHHVGVAVDMEYGIGLSGAYSELIPLAMKNYFNYDKNMYGLYRSTLGKNDWYNLVKNELKNNRPLYYSGGSEVLGHAFVCDGVDLQDYFHFNWGWGGTANGYYTLEDLTPNELGIGGGYGDYSGNQYIIVGFQKPTLEPEINYPQFYLYDKISIDKAVIDRSEEFNVDCSLLDLGNKYYTGDLAVGLYKNDQLVQIVLKNPIESSPNMLFTNFQFSYLKIDPSVENGDYQLYIIEQSKNDWTRIKGKYSNYLEVSVTDTQVLFSNPITKEKLSLVSAPVTNLVFSPGDEGNFSFTLRNDGEECFSKLEVQLVSSEGDVSVLNSRLVNLVKGEAIDWDFALRMDFNPDMYTLKILYYKDGVAIPFDYSREVKIAMPELEIEDVDFFEEIRLDDDLNVTVTLKNTEGNYSDNVYCYVKATSLREVYDTNSLIINLKNNESGNFTFTIDTKWLLPGNYDVYFEYINDGRLTVLKRNGEDYRGYLKIKEPKVMPEESQLSLEKLPLEKIDLDLFQTIDLSIKNEGGDYFCNIEVQLISQSGEKTNLVSWSNIKKGQTIQMNFEPYLLDVGVYNMKILYYKNWELVPFDFSKEILLVREAFVSNLVLDNINYSEELKLKEDLQIMMEVINKGRDYKGKITAVIKNLSDGTLSKSVDDVDLRFYESKQVKFAISTETLGSGEYELYFEFENNNKGSIIQLKEGTDYIGTFKIIEVEKVRVVEIIKEVENDLEFKVYPNPVINNLKIKSSDKIKSVQLFTLSGKYILETDKDEVDMSALKSGLYIVRVITEEKEIKFKVLKK